MVRVNDQRCDCDEDGSWFWCVFYDHCLDDCLMSSPCPSDRCEWRDR